LESDYWARRRISRRTFVRGAGAAAAGAAGFAVAGCGDDGGGATTPTPAGSAASPTAEPVTRGGTVRFPLVGLNNASGFRSLHPFETNNFVTEAVSAFHYSRLLRPSLGPTDEPTDVTKIEGDIVAKREIPDPLTHVFTLKPNIRWHDKAPMNGRVATATDFLKSYEAFVQTPPLALAPGASFGAPVWKSWTDVVDRVAAPDEKTVRITLKAPNAAFYLRLSSDRDFWFVPVESIDGGQARTDPVGTGPFVFERFDLASGGSWRRNPAYHDAPLPNFDRVEGTLLPAQTGSPGSAGAQQVVPALQSGGLDFSSLGSSFYPEWHPKLAAAGIDSFPQSPLVSALYFNFDNKPFNDLRVRQALSMAVDRDAGLKLQDPTAKGNWCSFLAPGHAPFYVSPRDRNGDYGASGKYWMRNVKEARALLSAATGSDTLKFKLVSSFDAYGPVIKQSVQAAVDTIREAGFEAEIVDQPYASYITTTFKGNMGPDSAALGPLSIAVEPDELFMRNYSTNGPTRNWAGTPIAEQSALDAMFEKQRALLDTRERTEFIKQIQFKMSESFLTVPTYAAAGWAFAQNWMRNFYPTAGYTGAADGLLKAYFTPERVARG
jgi:peptide/nickel transport system substrate-binding protein